MKLVGISGALAGDKTSIVVNQILVHARRFDSSIKTELVDLRDYEIDFFNGAPLADYNEDTWDVVQKIASADFLVFGTPIYQASISGALKNLFDHLPEYTFKHKVTGMVATGWSDRHFLVMEYHLRSILSYFKGLVPTGNVFVHNSAFNMDSDEIIDERVLERLQAFGEEMVSLQQGMKNQ
ncbi:NAD(P)H-dependent FAD/FMN reductase [Oceanobacillus oncorhynchi]|uniref:NAD(P)H-dependent FAD/FMN reductase n=1 Tax=Oceanobacillus oncorhynchi TaxID=545501 RepID=A0A0A1MYD9_9BACI|nr:NADPH-dependent FMN reductase [Oceanobacillus oncorhynchi]CEI84357.1 NAD(P)H-dependent FAD/FMN reductase [Oceanobacillus oncorhynchi]